MRGDPGSGSKVWEALDREIGKPAENCGQIAAHWEFPPMAAFHHRKNRRDLWSRLWAADVESWIVLESKPTVLHSK